MKKLKQYLFNPMVEGMDIADKELKIISNGKDIPLGCSLYRSYDRWEFTVETLENIPFNTLWKTLISCEAKIRINNNIIDCTTANKQGILNALDDMIICTYYMEATQVMFELFSENNVSLPNNKDGEVISSYTCIPKETINFLVFKSPRIVNGVKHKEGVLVSTNGKLEVLTEDEFYSNYNIVIGE